MPKGMGMCWSDGFQKPVGRCAETLEHFLRTEDDHRTMASLTALQQSGASIRRIAKELDLSPTTVARVVKEQAELAR
jgi:predicted transposase YdaD